MEPRSSRQKVMPLAVRHEPVRAQPLAQEATPRMRLSALGAASAQLHPSESSATLEPWPQIAKV
jgi:hypothetical protein